ncbi:HD domain-containing protein [Sciscionella marina]|uniref:HD domain-containing protein n=1 Tax=Sciscionella marina TaxID=508770 RepID=UPI00047592A1
MGPVQTRLMEQNPLPEAISGRLRDQLAFIIEIDKLKTVLRQSPLAAAARRENDAEHSWHLGLMVVLLAEYANEPIDIGHTVQLVIVHDLIEIYAGDTPLHMADDGQQERERAAADELFAILPADQGAAIRALWDEFEARETAEARFAKAMDRFQPILLNWMAKGGTWEAHGASVDKVLGRTAAIEDGAAVLGQAREQICAESVRRGWLAPEPADP